MNKQVTYQSFIYLTAIFLGQWLVSGQSSTVRKNCDQNHDIKRLKPRVKAKIWNPFKWNTELSNRNVKTYDIRLQGQNHNKFHSQHHIVRRIER